MKTFILAFLFSLPSLAEVCPANLEVANSSSYKLTAKEAKSLKKILKNKGFIEASGSELVLFLRLEIDRSTLKGNLTDSRSSAALMRGDTLLAEVKKDYFAIMNDVHYSEFGFTELLIAGSTVAGAKRRLLKAVKGLPNCGDLP
jgi:hypothetical protein